MCTARGAGRACRAARGWAAWGIAGLAIFGACRPVTPVERLEPPAADVPIYRLTEREVDAVLRGLWSREPHPVARVVTLARRHVGQPYRLGPLGEGGAEPYDPDPLYCLGESDCVTFVEQTWAMALSRDWEAFLDTLRRIRYRDGKVGMLMRNHFTEADWNRNNAWLLEDVTASLGGGRAAERYVQRVDRAAFFRRYGIGQELPAETIHETFIPRERLNEVAEELRGGDVVEFVRGPRTAPYVAHMGLLVRGGDEGKPLLVHSGEPAVQMLPLGDYFKSRPRFIGLKVLRLRSSVRGPRD